MGGGGEGERKCEKASRSRKGRRDLVKVISEGNGNARNRRIKGGNKKCTQEKNKYEERISMEEGRKDDKSVYGGQNNTIGIGK